MTKRDAILVVSIMTLLYMAAFAGGYHTARAKLDVMLEMGCRMRCSTTIVVPPAPYKGPSTRT